MYCQCLSDGTSGGNGQGWGKRAHDVLSSRFPIPESTCKMDVYEYEYEYEYRRGYGAEIRERR